MRRAAASHPGRPGRWGSRWPGGITVSAGDSSGGGGWRAGYVPRRGSGGRGGGLDRGEGDLHAGVEPFDLADPGAGLACGVCPAVVIGAGVGEAGGGSAMRMAEISQMTRDTAT